MGDKLRLLNDGMRRNNAVVNLQGFFGLQFPIIDRQSFGANVMLSSNNEPPNEGMVYFDMDGPKKERLASGFSSIPKEEDPNAYDQRRFEKPLEMEREEDRRDPEMATPHSGICDISQMAGPEGKKKQKRARRVSKIEEAENECELCITACRPYVEQRKARVNLKDPKEKEKQKKDNALNNSERFRKRNKEHIRNLELLLQTKSDELKKVKKNCIELQNMDRFLEFNFRKNKQKAVNFVLELADCSNLSQNNDVAQQLDQNMKLLSSWILKEKPQGDNMYGEAAEQMEDYLLHEMQKDNNDPTSFALENETPHNSQNDANEASQREFSNIATPPIEDKEERRKESNRRASAKCRENEKSLIERLSNDIREVWWDVEDKRYIETFFKSDYAKKLERAKECIDPLVEWVYYLLENLAQPVHFARWNQIVTDIEEIRATFDVKPFAD